ncbi:hypothetical protein HC028_01890 [Planosporangium flavigriseum]|uniref:Uncharacterized protein n=1 Tax=Planosporangium flavigriseum TaxID=373681 RepID=A0A8J3PK74_9ACTN|nr:hypothetical protein [Planosporangium flavigriseum]NJC63268.1 hypothetical protein [Planosporangium flavigriseum]GIG72542.1 hypothetical protein Pfl04_09460 [Planosporangium flavigriseum]
MVQVRLAQEWTDGEGSTHAAGETVDVDAVMLAELEANGIVAPTDKLPTDKLPTGESPTDELPVVKSVALSDPKQPKPDWAGMTGVEA